MKKIFLTTVLFFCIIMPANAKVNGVVSQNYFYDLEKTIMQEVSPVTDIKTGKFWDKNFFYVNKYRPIYLLSNKDLTDFTPKKQMRVIQRQQIPAVYNISLKTAAIKTVPQKAPPIVQKPQMNPLSLYERGKNALETDEKIDIAKKLKASKQATSYTLAIDLLNQVLKVEPANALAYCILGEIYYEQNDYEKAMENYAKSYRLNPYSAQSCYGIAKILDRTNKELAQKYYTKANDLR